MNSLVPNGPAAYQDQDAEPAWTPEDCSNFLTSSIEDAWCPALERRLVRWPQDFNDVRQQLAKMRWAPHLRRNADGKPEVLPPPPRERWENDDGKEDGAEDEAEDEAEGGAEGLDNRRKRSLGDVEIGDNMATIFERSPNRSE
eukprot:CAMPEP_0113884404 /NCGR_PEP_ID=MMETSP0780_2-20120614/10245_1 /TAXON_ID=652834 /ORGANISM="Palpitomonas bilix" /LENGTH=142 /DNA_ID=CAMNT_0000872033 /DNA_START=116 /DNA_END=545 /DNA_ORIENTATION=- /assembly_acc=CAM_ASM_000599